MVPEADAIDDNVKPLDLDKLHGISMWELANVAATDAKLKERAHAVFCDGSRGIEINSDRPQKDAEQVLTQFGHLAKSISIRGSGRTVEDMWILEVLSVIGSANNGNLEILRLWNCKLNFFSLSFEKMLPVGKLMPSLTEISMTRCQIENFRYLFVIAAKSLQKMMFNGCTMDADTQKLFALEFPDLRKLALIQYLGPPFFSATNINQLCRASPRIQELKICDRFSDATKMTGITRLKDLQILEVGTSTLFGSNWFRDCNLQRLKVVGGLPTDSAKLTLNDLPVIGSLKELVFLNSDDKDYCCESDRAKFTLHNLFDQELEFSNLEKFTISTEGDLNILSHVIPHMTKLKFFSFFGLKHWFDSPTLQKLLFLAPQLEIVNIIASDLPSLEYLMRICAPKPNNNWILSLRRGRQTIMRAYHCGNAVIFYPRLNDEKDEVEAFKLGPETEFSRAVAVAKEKKYLQIDDGEVFQIYFDEDRQQRIPPF